MMTRNMNKLCASPMLYSCRLTFSLNGKPYTFESRPDWAQL